VEVTRATDLREVSFARQLFGDHDDVGRFRSREHGVDGVEDDFVLREVEVFAAYQFEDFDDGVLRQQHSAQSAHFRRLIVRRNASVTSSLGHEFELWAGHRRSPPGF
jgi:hypothetical protein